VPWNAHTADALPRRIDDMNAARPGAVDIPFGVDFHSIGDAFFGAFELVKDARIFDRAVGLHVESADQILAAVVHVQHALVG
jgi:hypothetical protein